MLSLTKAGRYEIQGELGRGAMGVVYRAMDPVIGRTVAVKTLRLSQEGTGLSHTELLGRFQTEARAAGVLTHPNIVVVYDAGEEEGGLYYITMELVEGKSMQALLDSGQGFPLPRVLRIMEQTCSALQFAHERNIVHRDVKPANLMLTPDDTVKVTDFGTAKILQFGTVQQTAHVMGTPSYMSPEQVKGKVVDGRSDIFSLGVMLYEMVTGEKPFPGQNITTVIYKIVNEEPVPPRQIDSSIHPGLSAVVMKALAKDPNARYQSCRELMEDLKNYRAIMPAAAAGGNPQSTMALASNPEATQVVTPIGAKPEDVGAAARSLMPRATNPLHTPTVRRTGPIAPVEERKKTSPVVSVFVALLLLAVIYFGWQKIRPEFEAARQENQAHKAEDTANTATTPPSGADKSSEASTNAVAPSPEIAKPEKPIVQPAVAKKPESSMTPAAAEYQSQIEKSVAMRGLAGRLKIRGTGNTLTLRGKLRPSEHSELLKILKSAPAGVQVVDDVTYEDAAPKGTSNSSSAQPTPIAGRGTIYVSANVTGATAVIPATGDQPSQQCETPCALNGLLPRSYNLEVRKAGFHPMQTALQVRSGQMLEEHVTLEPLAVGLHVSSKPEGADVFINGAKQSGQTPVDLPLAPGQYNMVLRLQGYDAYSNTVVVKENVQTRLEMELKPRSGSEAHP